MLWKFSWVPVAGLLLTGGAAWFQQGFSLLAAGPAAAGLLLTGFGVYFFRDPAPRVPVDSEAIVAPAHGRVDCVDETIEPLFLGGSCRRISIFLSVFDVHVQNAPVAGRVVLVRHQAGRFLNALRTESAEANENVLLGIASLERAGERIAVRQIAGWLARRIVTWVRFGDQVERGERLGLIQFGSRCELYLPLSARVTVQPGSRVVAGQTIVATRPGASPGPASESLTR